MADLHAVINHERALLIVAIDPVDQQHHVIEQYGSRITSRWRATHLLKAAGYEMLGLWHVNTDHESYRRIQRSTTPALPPVTTITPSRYDQYDECPTCEQPAGSPCISLRRIPSGRSVHPLTNVHPGRPLEQKD